MRIKIVLFLSMLFSFECSGITDYKHEDTLFTWAKSGLNMRESPDFNSKVITKISFGKEVICKGRKTWYQYLYNSHKIIDKIEVSEGNIFEIELKGSWVKVRIDNFEGYVFDSYLSKFKPKENGEKIESLHEYFKQRCGSIKYLEKKDSILESGIDKIVFCNGIVLTNSYASGGFQFQMILPYFSIEEAFMLIREFDKYAITITQNKENVITILQDLGGYTIESYKNVIIISGEWAC